jgi:pyruvate-formate lyase-activating enzyme
MYKSKISPNSIPGFPNILVAALTNACTHKCDFCQYKNYSKHPDYILKHLDGKVFKKIVDEMSGIKNTALRLCAWGEPLMHPDIVEFVRYAASKKVKTVLLTNGYLLRPELSLELMKAGLSFVEVSIDAANIDTYQKVRVCDDKAAFFKVKDNVKKIIELRNKFDFKTRIVVSYVTWPNKESEDEFIHFENEWANHADDIVKRRLHSFMCAVDPGLIKVPDDRLPCYGLWARATVNPWGKIVICYNQWEKDKWAIADLNVSHTTIAGTWTGEKFSQLRRDQVNDIYTGPCENCNDYNPYAWEHPFEEVIEKVALLANN